MYMKHNLSFVSLNICFLAALHLNTAQACEIPNWRFGQYKNDCLRSSLKPITDPRIRVIRSIFPLAVDLPNLRIDDMDADVNGRRVDLAIEVENAGVVDSREVVDLTVEVIIRHPSNDPKNPGVMESRVVLTDMVDDIGAGRNRRVFLDPVFIPSETQDWDLHITAYIDPPTITNPSGEIYESNEEDNREMDVCRRYGPDPDQLGPQGCSLL